jgi:hypothetical protein
MIDKTLAHMIDESLRRSAKLSGIPRCNLLEIQTLLEIEVNQAHLVGWTHLVPSPPISGNLFVNPSPSAVAPSQ